MRAAGMVLAAMVIAVPGVASDAQDSENAAPANAAVDRMVENMLRDRERGGKFPMRLPDEARAVCSVPLREMPLPKRPRFTIKELTPRKNQRGPDMIPLSAMPAPPCSTKQD